MSYEPRLVKIALLLKEWRAAEAAGFPDPKRAREIRDELLRLFEEPKKVVA